MAKSELAMIPQQSAAMTPADLVAQALAIGNLDVIRKLLDYKERWESGEARKAFNAAMAAAKAEMPVIIKDQTVDFTSAKGRTNYKYEDMAGLARQVDPILTRHGSSYRYRTVSDKDCMTVICIVAHRDGHSEENSLTAPNDVIGKQESDSSYRIDANIFAAVYAQGRAWPRRQQGRRRTLFQQWHDQRNTG